MPKQLTPSSVSAPAFFGLNSQRKADILPFQWATKAENCVIDDSGRIAARKGYQKAHATAISTSPDVRSIFEYIDATGNKLQILASGNAIYKLVSGSLTDISGSITTPTADNWQFQNFNGKVVGYQSGHAPIVMATVGGSFADINYTAGAPSDTDAGLASFGRVWNIDGTSLLYSSTLDETNSIAGYGSFDLSSVWLAGMDIPVALAEFNGHLVVFGKSSIIVYSEPWYPEATVEPMMQVVENIGGIGCIARDSIQHIGTDILFLSGQGIRSLGRVIQEKSMPINDISKNVNDDLNALVASETLANIKSGYTKAEGFYLLTLPTANKSYYFDLRTRLQDGSYKATTWQTSFTGINVTSDGTIYLGTAGYINTYQGYLDNVGSGGSGGDTYDMVYESGWNDLSSEGQNLSAIHKLPKRLSVLLLGGDGQTVILKWAFDFVDDFNSFSRTIGSIAQAEYNIAEYNIAEYGGGSTYNRIKTPMSKSGQLIKLGINVTINGAAVAIQQIDMYSKTGRIAV